MQIYDFVSGCTDQGQRVRSGDNCINLDSPLAQPLHAVRLHVCLIPAYFTNAPM